MKMHYERCYVQGTCETQHIGAREEMEEGYKADPGATWYPPRGGALMMADRSSRLLKS